MQFWKPRAKRLAAWVCALALCCGMMPAAVAAEEPGIATPETAAAAPAEPEATETPAATETPEATEAPEVTETPEATEAPEVEPESEAVATAPAEITALAVAYNGTNVAAEYNGSYVVQGAKTNDLSDYTVSITLSEGGAFAATPAGTTLENGDFYVVAATEDTATLRFALSPFPSTMDEDQLDLTLTRGDDGVWSGGFAGADGVNLGVLVTYLAQYDIQLVAGALGEGSAARPILLNQDAGSVMLLFCAPDAVVNTVTYQIGAAAYTWKVLNGMPMPLPAFALGEGETLAGWYTDAAFENAVAEGATVTGDTTLYAKVTGGEEPGPTPDPDDPDDTVAAFVAALKAGDDVTINSLDKWEAFVENAANTRRYQLVTLATDINCGGATYDAMTFNGSFDGGNHKISNASFRAVTMTNGEKSSGMFASLGYGQVVANLVLENITAKSSSNYAGVLVGFADGYNTDRTLIQNVQVYGGSASGYTAGGVVGFNRNSEVRYCSSRDTTVTGLANGGGVVGLNNCLVDCCFSTSTPTALPSLLGGSAGGVNGKNVRGGHSEYCWAYMTVTGATKDGGGTDVNPVVVDPNVDDITTFDDKGLTQECWTEGDYVTTPVDFDQAVVRYTFS